MRNRLFYLLVVGFMMVSVMTASYGVWHAFLFRSPSFLAFGVTGIVASRALYLYGVDHADFAKMDTPPLGREPDEEGLFSDDIAAEIAEELRADPVLLKRLRELRSMEGKLAEMQSHYSEPGFDAWEVQAQRTRIASLIRQDDRLADFQRDMVQMEGDSGEA